MVMQADRDAWRQNPDTATMQPVVAMPPLRGYVAIARIGAAMATDVRGKRMILTVRERASYPEAKVVARCLGKRVGPRLVPCDCCPEAEAEGEDGFALLRLKHPTPETLRKENEQHVFALYSEDSLSPAEYELARQTYEDRIDALKASEKKPLERQALLAQWGGYPREPFNEPIGLLTDRAWGGE